MHQLLPPEEQTKPEEVSRGFNPCFSSEPAVCWKENKTGISSRVQWLTLFHFPLIQDVQYLSPIIREIERERKEREDLDAMVVKR